MGYEIDFLPVGDGSRSGDAIVLRYGNLFGLRSEQRVVVIDAGFADNGQHVVNHLKSVYGTDVVDLVISTHSDDDHAQGLITVLENCSVGSLWMHKPWEHTEDIAKLFRDGRVTDASVSTSLRKSLDAARAMERVANRKGIPIVEPFAGTTDSTGVVVLGPSEAYYAGLLPGFRSTPEVSASSAGLLAMLLKGATSAATALAEAWNLETLGEDGVTSAENNSSSIVLVLPEPNEGLLFTGDAGIPALAGAMDFLDGAQFDRDRIKFVQVPHHGSHRNVSPSLLDRMLGPKRLTDARARTAFVSVAPDGAPKHPSNRVTNAFRRRGTWVYSNSGRVITHWKNAPNRGLVPIEPVPFFNGVDQDQDAA